MKHILSVSAAALLAVAPACASVGVTAEVSRTRMASNEQLVLSVTVSGDQASLPEPQLPPLSGFSLYESGRSQSLSFVNGRMTAAIIYTYVLVPRAVGKFTIPPIRASGAAQMTQPLEIEVVRDAAAPPPGADRPAPPNRAASRRPDILITASLDKPRAFVNQQVTLSVRFLYATRLLGDSRYDAPKLTGFLSEDLPPVREGTIELNGRSYHFSEIKTALFPVQPGRLKIGPAVVHCQVARNAAEDPFQADFFDRLLSMNAPQTLTLNSNPLTLDVDPLPEGRPADFTGLVGRLSAKAEIDQPATKVGEALTLAVTVSGAGNIKSVPEPKRPDLPSVRFFTTESSVNIDRANDRVGGTKTFRTVLVPRVSGEIRLPPVEFSYFDPEARSYRRAATETLLLRAAPGAPDAHLPVAPQTAPSLTSIEADIRYLKTQPARSPLSAALAAFASLGFWHGLPAAFLLAAAAMAWRRRALDSDPRGRRSRAALRRAEERLRSAANQPTEQAARAAALIDEALAGFVADKLDVPTGGLTLKAALDGLAAAPHPPSAATLERLKEAWVEAGQRRFAPGGDGTPTRDFAAASADLLKTLEREMRR
ncbi:MAG: BatD family protein [Elusimicrobiota bacterium]